MNLIQLDFFENLAAGNYSVIIEDENNCSSIIDVAISQPDVLEVTVANISEVNCYEGSDGAVNLSSSGGTGTVQYTLGNETNETGIFENLPLGNYDFTITDENGCTDAIQISMDSPTQIVPMIVSSQNISCAGEADGMVEISATGGTNNFEYSYGNETNTTGIFSGISVGNNTFFATDGNGCVEEISITIEEPDAIVFENIQTQNVDCNGNSNGIIQLGANGGTGNLTFTLGNENNTTGFFENLPQGIYEVIATDENNCSTSTQLEIEEPTELEVATSGTNNIDCFGANNGSVEVVVTGGTGDIEYSLGNETNTSGVFENLGSGTYSIIATDENNCSITIEENVSEPAQLIPNVEELNSIDCFGSSTGSIQATATGGTGMPNFTLNNITNSTGLFENLPVGTYEVLVMDQMDCSEVISITIDQPAEIGVEILNNIAADCAGAATGSVEVQGTNGVGNFTYQLNGVTNTTGVFENLPSGIYDLLTTDGNGCEVSTTITISEESDITVESMFSTDVDCFGNENGTITIIAGSPAGNLTYELDGMTNTTGLFENLPAGSFNVIISDANNCSTILSFEITEPTVVNLEVAGIVPVDCFGASTGEVMLSASGGNGDFTYTLNGETNNTGIFENVPAGMYDVVVTDGDGCSQTQSVEVEEPELLVIEVTVTTDDLGNGNGTVTFVSSGGTPPYLFSLDGANFQSGELFVNLAAGNYEGFVEDGNGCISQTTFTIFMETAIINPDQGVSKLEILPNPFSENLFLDAELEISQDLELTMWTVSGIEIFNQKIHLQKGNHRIDLNVNAQLAAGAYFLKVRNENGSIGYFKLIKY